MSENKPNNKVSTTGEKVRFFIKETVETIVIVLVLVIFIRTFIGEPRWIPSSSMEPTLQIKDNLIVEKVSRYFSKPDRGDILVFFPPQETLNPTIWGKFTRMIGFFSKDEAYIKRVIGLPGEEIKVVPDVGVYVNGKLLKEAYVKDVARGFCAPEPEMHCGPIKVPQDSYYMMGDNRNDSTDSRFWGFLPEKRIVGRACFRFWPLNRIGILNKPQY
jgi:signal peptidase I